METKQGNLCCTWLRGKTWERNGLLYVSVTFDAIFFYIGKHYDVYKTVGVLIVKHEKDHGLLYILVIFVGKMRVTSVLFNLSCLSPN